MKFTTASVADAIEKAPAGSMTVLFGGAEKSAVCEQVIAQSTPQLAKKEHYLVSHLNVANPDKPILVLDWQAAGNSSMERRWLAQKCVDRVEKLSATKSWRLVLDEGATAEHLAMAEDFYRATCDTLDGRSKLESVEFIASDWQKIDPHKDVRLCHQLGYRDWVNANPDEMTSLEIGKQLETFAGNNGCECQILDVDELQTLGMNLLLAVGQASKRSPSRLIMLTKNWQPGAKNSLMLVGKGVTFDTGGINVKAHEHFVNCMKNDMGGAALMSHLFMALVEGGYDQPLALVVPACENLVDASAMKPGSVITSYSGKRVMVEHTDAEGRLILADALSYANEKLKPAQTFVAATLTTAALRQFTNFYTPVHFADENCRAKLQATAQEWGEGFTFWDAFLPFVDSNKAKVGELTNMGRMPSDSSMGGGSNVAAHFLKEFCPSPMVHFDIFATAWNWSRDYPGAKYGATGAPFNSLFAYLMARD